MRHLRLLIAVALVGVTTFAGANALGSTPQQSPSRRAAPVARRAQVPRRIDVVGDSITLQSSWHRGRSWRAAGVGLAPGDHVKREFWLSYRFEDVRGPEAMRVGGPVGGRPSVLVIAQGINNALSGPGGFGWDGTDAMAFAALLRLPSPRACVVVVLPQVGNAVAPESRLQIEAGRADMAALASARPRTVVVDWGDVVARHPEYLAGDGIHLESTAAAPGQLADAEAADAYAGLLWQGVHRCPV